VPSVQCPKCIADKRSMWSVYPGINEYSKGRIYPEVDKECLWCELCNTFYILKWEKLPDKEWFMKLKEVNPVG